jgi:hypothetical protein
MVLQVRQVQQDPKDRLARLDPKVLKARLDPKAPRVNKGSKDR